MGVRGSTPVTEAMGPGKAYWAVQPGTSCGGAVMAARMKYEVIEHEVSAINSSNCVLFAVRTSLYLKKKTNQESDCHDCGHIEPEGMGG